MKAKRQGFSCGQFPNEGKIPGWLCICRLISQRSLILTKLKLNGALVPFVFCS